MQTLTLDDRMTAAAALIANQITALTATLSLYDDAATRDLITTYREVYQSIADGQTDRFSLYGDLDDEAYDLAAYLRDALTAAWN